MNDPETVVKLAHEGDAKSQYELALAYELGVGFQKDWQQALVWYQKSAEQNYAKAQYNLGTFYALGKAVEKDIQQAKYWIKKANENGYSGGGIF